MPGAGTATRRARSTRHHHPDGGSERAGPGRPVGVGIAAPGVVTRRVAATSPPTRPVAGEGADPVVGGGRARRRAVGSRELGIDLGSGRPAELFKWLLACLLFGKPIQQPVAARTYREFAKAGLLTPRAIREAGWDRLVDVLDRGHYVRFDFSTATRLLDVCTALQARYRSLGHLLRQSTSRAEVARRLQAFKGVGPTTTRIFLRDVATLWPGYERLAGGQSRGRRRDRGRTGHV